jgi:pimeloyl-ACP methyl ester carboxylesterase
MAPLPNGIEICYETFGNADDPPLLLVMGLGGPMNWWSTDLCRLLADRGFFVIRYDHRDIGHSSHIVPLHRVTRRSAVTTWFGGRRQVEYGLGDLASDAFGLLDHLGAERADVFGVSMGGMIAQTMAIEHPERVRSLTSIMSTTGRRAVGWQHPRLLTALLRPLRPGREAYAESSIAMWHLIGSPGFPRSDHETREVAYQTFDRGIFPGGTLRQMMAILTQPNRSERLHDVRVPTLVIHGLRDKMVHVSGGRATAAAIPGAVLLLVDGMGHDLPPQLFQTFADAIHRTAARA